MYDQQTAVKIKDMASNSIDAAQQKIGELDNMSSANRHQAGSYLLGWQSWLGNVSFTLSAIGGAVLLGKDAPHLTVVISLLLFLVIGIWVTIYQKRQFEHAAANATIEIDKFRPLYEDKKKAAYSLYEDPANVTKHMSLLNQELKIIKLSKELETEMLSLLRRERITYLNDIWLALIVTAIYLLIWPVFIRSYSSLQLDNQYFLPLIISIWFLFILVIAREAMRSKVDIKRGTKSKILKVESQLRHSNEHIAEIESKLASLKPHATH